MGSPRPRSDAYQGKQNNTPALTILCDLLHLHKESQGKLYDEFFFLLIYKYDTMNFILTEKNDASTSLKTLV